MRNGKSRVRSMFRALRSGEAGGALVETALTAPVLVLLVLGAVEFARVACAAIEVTNAARAGVAYGAQNGGTASDTPGITWAHLDLYAWNDQTSPGHPEGGEAYGMRALFAALAARMECADPD